jgi:hypothetical protein
MAGTGRPSQWTLTALVGTAGAHIRPKPHVLDFSRPRHARSLPVDAAGDNSTMNAYVDAAGDNSTMNAYVVVSQLTGGPN